jgi:uncharacterized protein (DUF2384 family)
MNARKTVPFFALSRRKTKDNIETEEETKRKAKVMKRPTKIIKSQEGWTR